MVLALMNCSRLQYTTEPMLTAPHGRRKKRKVMSR
jgi:hypothetical protein